MSLFEKKQLLSRESGLQKPQRTPVPPKRPLEKKREYTREEFRGMLRKASPSIPGGGGMFGQRERIELEKKLLPYGKYGGYISEIEIKKTLRELRKAEYGAKTDTEKLKIGRQRRFLEEVTGFKGKY